MGIRESTKDRFKMQRELVVDLKSTPGSSQTPDVHSLALQLPQGASLPVHNLNHRHIQQISEITTMKVVLRVSNIDGLKSFFCIMAGRETRTKAMKIAVRIPGVMAASLKGNNPDQIEVDGVEIDTVKLTALIRKKVGHADIISVAKAKIRKDPSPDTSSTLPKSDTLPLDGYGSQNFCTQQEERLPGITLHDSRAVEDHNEERSEASRFSNPFVAGPSIHITEEPSSYPSLVLQSSQSFENPLDGCGSQNFNAQSEEQFSTEDPVFEISLDDFFAGADQNEDRSEASRFSNPSMAGPSTHISEEPSSYPSLVLQSSQSFENPLDGCGSQNFNAQSEEQFSSEDPVYEIALDDFFAGEDHNEGKRVLKRPQERHEWIKAESARLKLETAKSEMAMETNNSKYKAKMGIKVALAQMQLEFEKEKYQLMEKHYQIALAFSLGLFILFLALYVTRI
ncbi:uncharacterized protein LOC133865436 isoform X2 [Alnus glutinosa]|uniref:uncharacterized protein LOC133865436 isoform X2 n=1 Tax=Alnus glutinosa TaxID=3517 RepID=UPI002D77CD37|nr:uncharacterized protein LOC133865436 isoform X2 [Alnus glutinosa]